MKRLLPLLFIILLLSACAPSDPPAQPPQETASPEPVSLYLPQSAIETDTHGAVRAYALPVTHATGILPMGEDLLLLSGDAVTTLTLLSGDGFFVRGSLTLDRLLSPAGVTIHESGLSYFDPAAQQTVVLDESLSEVRRITAPEDMVGHPILCKTGTTLYYCTPTALRAWDLESGIRRLVKEMGYPTQQVTALHQSDTILQCCVTDADGQMRTLVLSTENGRLLREKKGFLTLETTPSHYYATFPSGVLTEKIFGFYGEDPSALVPNDLDSEAFFLNDHTAVTCARLSDNTFRLDHYDLDTGLRCSSLTLPAGYIPLDITQGSPDTVLILTQTPDQDLLLRWDPEKMRLNDGNTYTDRYYTATDPDYLGLAQCQAYADQISETYGIEIKIWLEAMEILPREYHVEAEYQVPLILRELTRLEDALSVFPEGFLETTAANFTGLRISLVRSLQGSNGVSAANGVQFFDGTDAHILLTPGEKLEQSLYHELYHVMETQIFNESIALDQWDTLNPSGFSYDFDYGVNARRDGSAYLSEENRSFIDTYSMSYPKEDRARLLEYAMTPDHAHLFQSSQMQTKLSQLCQGIREAYSLEKSGETFLWEQYLHTS